MAHPLKLGLWTPNTNSWQTLQEQWTLIEEYGFDCTGLADHFMPTGGDIDQSYVEGWIALTALAVMHPRLRVAVLVSGNTYRHPALLAKMAATLDVALGGRLDLGIGAGWYVPEHVAYGITLPSAGERVERLREAIEIIRALQQPGRTTYAGKHYQITDAPFAPLSPQPNGLPIMVGAQGPRMLRLVAELADAWNLNHGPDEMARLGAQLDAHCVTVGRDPGSVRRVAFGFPAVLDVDPFSSVDAYEGVISRYVAAGADEISLRMPDAPAYATLEQVAKRLPELRARFADAAPASA